MNDLPCVRNCCVSVCLKYVVYSSCVKPESLSCQSGCMCSSRPLSALPGLCVWCNLSLSLSVFVCNGTSGPPTRWQWEWMSTSSPAVSEGTSICQCDALWTGTDSITQCPASLSQLSTLLAPTRARAWGTHKQITATKTHFQGHMTSCKHKHISYTHRHTICDAETRMR